MIINTIETIKDITFGAEYIFENENRFVFRRYREKELEAYRDRPDMIKSRLNKTAGVRLSFITNSKRIKLSFYEDSYCFQFVSFDIYIDGVISKTVNHSNTVENIDFVIDTKNGDEKHIEVYLPWQADSQLKYLEVDDGSYITGKARGRQIVCYGDSVTQGMYAEHTSLTYVNRIARFFDADVMNKGAGGDVFTPELVCERSVYDPAFITVAYGSNDWMKKTKAQFVPDCEGFLERLVSLYRNKRIYVILPKWRGDMESAKKTFEGSYFDMRDTIREIAEKTGGITVVDGMDIVPHNKDFFFEKYLHPNDLGFGVYAENLVKAIGDIK